MTGLLGGGHAIHYESASGRVRNLDCFVAVPGLGAERREPALVHLDVPFGAELVHYAVGPASCAVPGLPAGLEALWREHGRLPWPRLVEPARRLASDGVEFLPAHAACLAMLAPVMTMDEGARIYAPRGPLLQAGDRLEQPGLGDALQALADDPADVYRGSIGESLLALSAERGGLLTQTDLDAYDASIKKLAALAPQVKMVLGAHNVPVASPDVLPELVTAFEAVRAGKVAAGEPHDGKVIYKTGKFSFLMKAAK